MEVIAVTNRLLSPDDFFSRIHMLAKLNLNSIILREKDLDSLSFNLYASECFKICRKYDAKLIVNTFIDAAIQNNIPNLHLGFNDFLRFSPPQKNRFSCIGVSVHSVHEAVEAYKNGADYLIAGHIFPTACKPGFPPRGLDFLKTVCLSVDIPVFAIGGINSQNANSAISAGAYGICIMSPAMTYSQDALIREFNLSIK